MVKRAVCVLLGHNWTRHRYEGTNFPPGTLAGGF